MYKKKGGESKKLQIEYSKKSVKYINSADKSTKKD